MTTAEAEVSLRESLEAAIETVEKPTDTTPVPSQAPTPSNTAPATDTGSQEASPVAPKAQNAAEPGKSVDSSKTSTPIEQVAPAAADPLPKSWKPTVAEKWKTLDPDVKAEVIRREREMTKAFGENNQVREFHKQFGETVRPFEARLRSVGVSPLQAVGELFKADHILSSAPPTQRAQYVAKLVKDYGVDIRELDAALAGEAAPDPVASRVEQLLAERLAPYQQFMSQQREMAALRDLQVQQEAGATIEQMAADTAKFPYFEHVREDMADIIEMGAKRGLYFSPEQAYTRALAMNPEWNAQVAAQNQAAAQMSQAQAANAKAQKALGAASSVSGAPGGSPAGVNPNGSLRDTIEAAWAQVAGR